MSQPSYLQILDFLEYRIDIECSRAADGYNLGRQKQ